ncbi:hypothetical protein DL96DRAFT_1427586, partial [Flagelloscypha sp. PMI_526]
LHLEHTRPSEVDFVQSASARNIIISHIREAEAQLGHIQGVLDGLLTTRRALEDFIVLQNHRLAPVRTLPTEILSLVFEALGLENNIVSVDEMPVWAASQVCRTWRATALSNPRLWD